jgi:hypothetical protein
MPQESVLGRWPSEEAVTALSGRFGNPATLMTATVTPVQRLEEQLRN